MSAEAQTEQKTSRSRPNSLADLPFRLEVFMEPKGFIRAIEFVLAICMFATTAGYNSMFSFLVNCKNESGDETYSMKVNYTFGYPFGFTDRIVVPCFEVDPIGESPSGAAKFFVAVGVLGMLYAIAALVWYVVLEARFLKYEIVSIVDFIATCVFTLLFFIASCAWAAGVTTVKFWTTLDDLTKDESILAECNTALTDCISEKTASYSSLNISILFGFLNVLVWAGNVWFVWKETPWFRSRAESQTGANLGDNKV